jgi:hypothetical protein
MPDENHVQIMLKKRVEPADSPWIPVGNPVDNLRQSGGEAAEMTLVSIAEHLCVSC